MNSSIFDMYGILAVIRNNNGDTIEEIGGRTHVPIEILKRNLQMMYDNVDMFKPYEELQMDIVNKDDDVINDGIDDGINNINIEDNVYISSGIDEENISVTLSGSEKNLFMTIMAQNQKGRLKDIEYKNINGIGMDDSLIRKLICIDCAIRDSHVLYVAYKGRNGNSLEMFIEPLGIVFYEFENLFYVIGQYEDKICFYKLDRMESVTENRRGKKTFVRNKDFSMEKYLENVWGMEFGSEVKVKVKFLKEANVEYKVKRDIEYRKNKIIHEFEDYFIYEDTIVGIHSFKSWLRSYGSSAIVLEPQNLRDEMIESARKMYEYYSSTSL